MAPPEKRPPKDDTEALRAELAALRQEVALLRTLALPPTLETLERELANEPFALRSMHSPPWSPSEREALAARRAALGQLSQRWCTERAAEASAAAQRARDEMVARMQRETPAPVIGTGPAFDRIREDAMLFGELPSALCGALRSAFGRREPTQAVVVLLGNARVGALARRRAEMSATAPSSTPWGTKANLAVGHTSDVLELEVGLSARTKVALAGDPARCVFVVHETGVLAGEVVL